MAYETPIVSWQQDRSEEDDRGRSYFAGGTVIADSRSDAYEALTAFGIIVGEEYDDYPDFPCVRRSVEKNGSGDLYDWVAEFQGTGEDGSTDPNQRPIYVEWREGKEAFASHRDAYGRPVLGTSGEKLPAMSDDADTFFIAIYKWEVTYNAAKRMQYAKTCNSDTVNILNYTLNPGEVALRSYLPTGRIQYRASGDQVPTAVEVMYLLELRGTLLDSDGNEILDDDLRTGFYERKLDEGVFGYYTDSEGNTRLGPIQVKGDTGWVKVTSPVPLLNGVPIDESGTYAVAGKSVTDWEPQALPAGVVYDESLVPRAAYILVPRLRATAYATLLD